MRVVYEAFDGSIFHDESECRSYENMHMPKYIDKVSFFHEDKSEHHIDANDIYGYDQDLDYDYYQYCTKLIIHTDEEYKEFIEIAEENGWCEYYDQITGPGTWVRTESEDTHEGKWLEEK